MAKDIRIIPSSGQINVTGSADFRGLGGTSVLYVSGSGRVGVKTTDPSDDLHVAGTFRASDVTGHRIGNGTDTSVALSILDTSMTAGNTNVVTLGRNAANNNQAEITFHLAQTGSTSNRLQLGLYNSNNTLNILGSGRVGIGTESPSYKLHIVDTTSSSHRLFVENLGAGQSSLDLKQSSNHVRIITDSAHPLRIYDQNNAAERITLTSDGSIGIGTTAPSALLHVYSTGNGEIEVQRASGALFNIQAQASLATIGTDSNHPLYLKTNGGTRLQLTTGGALKLNHYGSGTHTGTVAYNLAVDSSGNVIESAGAVLDGSGTANYIPKWSDSNTLTDSVIYETGNNIGIGTTSPSSKLEVKGSADVVTVVGSGSAANTSVFAVDGNYGRLFEVSDDLSDSLFSVNTIAGLPVLEVFANNKIVAGAYNQNDLVITGSKVGIGTNAPLEALDVVGWARMDYGVVENAIYVGNSVNHWGDSDTNMTFTDDQLVLNAGGVEFIRLYEQSSGDTLIINEDGADLDLRVEGDTDVNLIKTDAANDRVGIGTGTPGTKLQVNGDWVNNYGSINISHSANTLGGLGLRANDVYKGGLIYRDGTAGAYWELSSYQSEPFLFRTNNTERMRIESTGDVGVGAVPHTAGPTWRTFYVGSSATIISRQAAAGTDMMLANNHYIDSSNVDKRITTGGTSRLFINQDVIRFQRSATGAADSSITWSESMRITADGNVGIGTTSPTANLEVYGNGADTVLKIHEDAGTNVARLHFRRTTTDAHIQIRTSGLEFRTEGNISTAVNPAMWIENDGTVNIYNDLTVDGIVTAKEFHTTFVSASIVFQSGSTKFGDTSDDVHEFTGRVGIGTASPQYQLDVTGSENIAAFRARNGNYTSLRVGRSDSGVWWDINHAGGDYRLYSQAGAGSDILLGVNAGGTDQNNRVGIGTATPATRLHVLDAASANHLAKIRVEGGATSGYGELGVQSGYVRLLSNGTQTYAANSNNSYFYISGAAKMALNSTGLGIFTSAPTQRLDVRGNMVVSGSTPRIFLEDPSLQYTHDISLRPVGSGQLEWRFGGGTKIYFNNHSIRFGDYGSGTGTDANNRDPRISKGTSNTIGDLIFTTNNTSRLFISGSGEFGYGTTTPTQYFDVAGVAYFRGGTAEDFGSGNTPTDTALIIDEGDFIYTKDNTYLRKLIGKTSGDVIQIGDSGTSLIDEIRLLPGTTNGIVSFYNNTSESARFQSGNLGIGTTSPGAKLHIYGGANTIFEGPASTDIDIRYRSNGTNKYNMFYQASTDGWGLYYNPGSAYRLYISGSGNVGIGTNTPTTTLDVNGNAVINGIYRGGTLQVNDYNDNIDGARIYGYSNNEMLSLISRYDQADGGLFFKRGNNGIESTIGQINFVSNQFRMDATVGSFLLETSGTAAISVDSSQAIRFHDYGSGNNTGTAAYNLQVDSSGHIIETAVPAESSIGGGGVANEVAVFSDASNVSGSQRFVFTDSGCIGIGTSSPAAQLHLVNSAGSWDRHISIQYDASNIGNILVDTEGMKLRNMSSGNNFYFRNSSNATTFYISDGSQVAIGTTSPLSTGGAAKLTIIGNSALSWGSSDSDMAYFRRLSAGNFQWQTYNSGNTGNIHLQPYGGNVGIGTTSPSYKLEVTDTIFISGSTFGNPNTEGAYKLKFWDNGGTYNDTGIGIDGSGFGQEKMWFNALYGFYFNYGTGGQKITFDSSGNVGIGEATPSAKLHVSQSGNGTLNSLIVEDNARKLKIGRDQIGAYDKSDSATQMYLNPGANISMNSSAGGTIIGSTGLPSNTKLGVIGNISGSGDLFIEGSAGIGTNSPVPQLHLVYTGGTYANDSTSGFINQATTGRSTMRLRSITDNPAELFFDIDGGIRWDISARGSSQGHTLNFYPAAATPAYSQVASHTFQLSQNGDVIVTGAGSSGKMGVGTDTPLQRLHVAGGHILIGNNNYDLRGKDTGGTQRTLVRINSSNEAEYGWSGAGPVKFMGGGSYTERMRIHTNGGVGIGATAPTGSLHINQSSVGIQGKGYETTSNPDPNNSDNAAITIDGNYTDGKYRSRFIKVDRGGNLSVYYQESRGTAHDFDNKVRFGDNSHSSADLQVFGEFEARGVIRLTHSSGAQRIVMGNRDSSGVHNPSIIEAANGQLLFGGGNNWSPSGSAANGGTMDYTMTLSDGGSVGIGTVTPASKLQVYGNTNGAVITKVTNDSTGTSAYSETHWESGTSGNELRVGVSHNYASTQWNNAWVYAINKDLALKAGSTGKSIKFYTNGSDESDVKAIINSNGSVGIGVVNPSQTLTVSGSGEFGGANPRLYLGNRGSGYSDAQIRFNDFTWGIYDNNRSDFFIRRTWASNLGDFLKINNVTSGADDWITLSANSGSLFYTDDTLRMRIAGNGNIGIGTSSPSYKLDVAGALNINANSTNGIRFEDDGTFTTLNADAVLRVNQRVEVWGGGAGKQYLDVRDQSGNVKVMLNAEDNSYFAVNNVGIGTTSPAEKLHVVGAARIDTIGNASTDTDKFLVSDSGTIKYRTASQLKSDLDLESYIHTIPNTAGSAQWVKLGTVNLPQSGRTVSVKVVSNQGYNANINQNFEIHIRFKTSNASSQNSDGFYGDSSFYVTGINDTIGPGDVVWSGSTADHNYDLFVNFGSFTGEGSYYVAEVPAGSWTHVGDTGQSVIGAGTSTELVSTERYDVASPTYIDANFDVTGRATIAGSVGIGTTSPSYDLDVYGNGSRRFYVASDVYVNGSTDFNITGTSRRINFSSGTGTIRTTSANSLILATNSTTALTIDSNQNTTLAGDLTVDGTITAQEFHTTFVSASIVFQSGSTKFGNSGDDIHHFTGNVGIGTSAPGSIFEIFENDTNGQIATYRNNTGYFLHRTYADYGNDGTVVEYQNRIGVDGNYGSTGMYSNHDFQIRTNNASRILVTNGGNVGIGTTGNVAYRLTLGVADQTGGDGIFLQDPTANTYGAIWFYDDDNSQAILGTLEDGSANQHIKLARDTTYVSMPGRLGIGTDSPIAALHINNFNLPQILLDGGGDTNGDIVVPNGEILQVGHWNTSTSTYTDRFRIISDGNVGIGTTSPAAKLHVQGNTYTTGQFSQGVSTANKVFNYGAEFRSSGASIQIVFGRDTNNTGSGAIGADANSIFSAWNVDSGASEKFRIDKSGNLYVNQYIYHDGDTDTAIRFTDDDIQFNAGGLTMFKLTEGTTDEVVVNPDGANLNFRVEGDTDTDLIKTDASNNRVGIGTASPRSLFHVDGVTSTGRIDILGNSIIRRYEAGWTESDQDILYSAWDGTQGDYVYLKPPGNSSTAHGIVIVGDNSFQVGRTDTETGAIATPDTTWMYINSSGNVGIGTTSPVYKIQAKTDSTTWGYRFENNTSDQDIHVFLAHGGGYGLAVDSTDNSASTYLLALKGGTGGADLGTVERFRVTSAGNVGIGTTGPERTLDVRGDMQISGSASTGLRIVGGDDDEVYLIFGDAADNSMGALAYNNNTDSLSIDVNNAERARIHSSGTVVIGDTYTQPAGSSWTTSNSQLILGGSHNAGFNTGTKAKLVISGYDNDGNTIYPIVVEDENGQEDFWLKNRASQAGTPIAYFAGSVGIGTTSPGDPLHIVSSGTDDFIRIENSSTYTGLWMNDSGTNNGWLVMSGYTDASSPGDFAIREYGVQTSLTIKQTTGNVGIGSTSPNSKLEVVGGADVVTVVGSGSAANTSVFAVDGNYGRLFEVSDDLSDSLFSVNTIAGLPVLEVFADNTIVAGAYNQNDLVVTGSRVGIGTDTPDTKLHVYSASPNPTIVGKFENPDGQSIIEIQSKNNTLGILQFGDPEDGNPGAIQYDHSGNSMRFKTADAERVRIDSNGDVGIGLTAPAYTLDVSGSMHVQAGANGSIKFGNSTSNYVSYYNTDVYFRANGIHYFEGNGSYKGAWNSNGNLGIGSINPSAPLDVEGGALGSTSGDSTTAAIIRAGRQNLVFKDTRTANGSDWNNATFKMIAQIDTTDHQSIDFVNDGSYLEHIDIRVGNQAFSTRFTSAGRVGIGTATPAEKLHVQNGNARVTGGNVEVTGGSYRFIADHGSNSGGVGVSLRSTGANLPFVQWEEDGDLHASMRATNAGHFYIMGNGYNTRMFIQSGSGNVGVNKTNPSRKLEVGGDFEAEAITINNEFTFPTTDGSANQVLQTNGSGTVSWATVSGGAASTVNTIASNTNGTRYLTFVDSNNASATAETLYTTDGIYINPSTDTIYATGNIISYASSDRRLKDNLTPIADAVAKLTKVSGYEFDWNDKAVDFEGHDIGVVAQEIEEILPEVVTTRKDGYKAVKYEKLTAILIEGVKEQQTQIQRQQSEIDELRSELKAIRDILLQKP